MELSKAGACTFSGGPSPYVVVLTVNDDGSFVGEPIFVGGAKKGERDSTRIWMGEILSDLKVKMVAQNRARCSGEERKYNVLFAGQFSEKKGKYQLELKGTDNVCPVTNCVFESTLRLQQK